MGGVEPRSMAHPNPRMARTGRSMAHPVRKNPVRSFAAAVAGALPNERDAGVWGFVGRLGRRVVPRDQRRRELIGVVALLLAAGTVSASLPGGWANSASPAAMPAAQLVAGADASSTPTPTEASASPNSTLYIQPVSTPSPTESPSPTPAPTPTKPPAPAKTPAPVKVYTFVAIGDSLTAWPTESPWPDRLDKGDANLQILNNAGVPGDTTADMRGRFDRDVLAYKPNVVFILGGTNDLGHKVSQATTIANLKAMVVAAKAKGIRVFLMTIPPDSFTSMAPYIDSLNAAIVRLGNANAVVVIDIHSPLSTSDGVYVRKFTSDGLHFSVLGSATVATAVHSRVSVYGY
jgi:lysophospholipase L1-like esterase